MGLTRIRAQQISDIDYKQAVRVITLTNITLSGGAPATVDGVSLQIGDRILVNGQTNAAQNGLYQVQILGSGENGTWVRTSDGNQDGEIQPGMVVMVTQGTVYGDTPWKLITNGEIIIGTTELTFQENYSLAFGNVYANGTAVVANTVSAAVTLTAGNNIEITGNNTDKSITIGVTGISLNSIANGTSNVDIATADGNVTITVNGNTTLTVTDTGANVDGYIDASEGNITGNFTVGGTITGSDINGIVIGNVTPSTGAFTQVTITSQGELKFNDSDNSNYVSLRSAAAVTGNVTWTLPDEDGSAGQVLATDGAGNLSWITAASGSGDSIFSTGGTMGLVTQSPTDTEDLGLVTELVGESYDLGTFGVEGIVTNENIVNGSLSGNKFAPDTDLATTGNLSVGNLTVTGALEFDTISANNATISANVIAGNITANTAISTVGNITGNNFIGNSFTGTSLLSTTGNIDISSNLIPTANVTYDLGNTTNRWHELYLAGNSIYLGGIVIKNTEGNTVEFFGADGSTPATISDQNVDTTTISHGDTSMGIPDEGGNIVANVAGNVVTTIHNTGLTVSGDTTSNFFVSPRTISANTTVGNINAMSSGPIVIADGVTVTVSEGGEWTIV